MPKAEMYHGLSSSVEDIIPEKDPYSSNLEAHASWGAESKLRLHIKCNSMNLSSSLVWCPVQGKLETKKSELKVCNAIFSSLSVTNYLI